MVYYMAIALGGACGAMSRYWLSGQMEKLNNTAFPLGTFSVNLIGSLLMGLFAVLLLEKLNLSEPWRPLILVGFLGAMTTFSTFSIEALQLLQQGNFSTALFYIAFSVAACLLAVWVGMQLARLII